TIRLASVGAVRLHGRVTVIGRRDERLLDRARGDPADQVPHRARLVVRAGSAGTSERLLPDDCTRGLVVDVEVPGRILERLFRFLDRSPVAGEHGSGEPVRSRRIDELEGLLPAVVRVD